MNTRLDELLGKELAGKLAEALGLGNDKDKANDVMLRMHDLEIEFLMDSLHDSPGGETVSDVYHRALLLALAKTVINEMHTEELEADLSDAREDARYVLAARDRLDWKVEGLRTMQESVEPLRALASKLAVYITATPGTLNAFMPDVAAEVDEYLLGQKVGQMNPKIEAIKVIRQALLCGLKEAKDLVEARMAMHEADRVAELEAKGIAVEKLVPVANQPGLIDKIGAEFRAKDAAKEAWDKKFEKLNRTGPLKWCVKCGRFMPIDADRKILSHPNLFTGVECEGTEVGVGEDADDRPNFVLTKVLDDGSEVVLRTNDTMPQA